MTSRPPAVNRATAPELPARAETRAFPSGGPSVDVPSTASPASKRSSPRESVRSTPANRAGSAVALLDVSAPPETHPRPRILHPSWPSPTRRSRPLPSPARPPLPARSLEPSRKTEARDVPGRSATRSAGRSRRTAPGEALIRVQAPGRASSANRPPKAPARAASRRRSFSRGLGHRRDPLARATLSRGLASPGLRSL